MTPAASPKNTVNWESLVHHWGHQEPGIRRIAIDPAHWRPQAACNRRSTLQDTRRAHRDAYGCPGLGIAVLIR